MQRVLTEDSSSGSSSVTSDIFSSQGTLLSESDPEKILSTLSNKITKDFPPYPQIHTQIKYVQKSMEDYLSPAFYMIPAIDNTSENVIYINNGHITDNLSLHHPRPRRLPRTFISECLLCKPSSRSNPLCAELWRIHRGLGHLQRDDELLLFHTDERAGYIISTQLICHSGTICTYRYGNPLRWLEACRCGGFFPHLWNNGWCDHWGYLWSDHCRSG